MKVDIDKNIIRALQERVNVSKDYNNVDQYINYILEQIVDRFKEQEVENAIDPAEQKKIEQQLKRLGYEK